MSGTYQTVQDYIDVLNADGAWVIYDASANTAAMISIADFTAALKTPSKDVGAFDALDSSRGENVLFGYGIGAHFDVIEAALLAGTDHEGSFTGDMERTDRYGNTVGYRVDMYNPMYYPYS